MARNHILLSAIFNDFESIFCFESKTFRFMRTRNECVDTMAHVPRVVND